MVFQIVNSDSHIENYLKNNFLFQVQNSKQHSNENYLDFLVNFVFYAFTLTSYIFITSFFDHWFKLLYDKDIKTCLQNNIVGKTNDKSKLDLANNCHKLIDRTKQYLYYIINTSNLNEEEKRSLEEIISDQKVKYILLDLENQESKIYFETKFKSYLRDKPTLKPRIKKEKFK